MSMEARVHKAIYHFLNDVKKYYDVKEYPIDGFDFSYRDYDKNVHLVRTGYAYEATYKDIDITREEFEEAMILLPMVDSSVRNCQIICDTISARPMVSIDQCGIKHYINVFGGVN